MNIGKAPGVIANTDGDKKQNQQRQQTPELMGLRPQPVCANHKAAAGYHQPANPAKGLKHQNNQQTSGPSTKKIKKIQTPHLLKVASEQQGQG